MVDTDTYVINRIFIINLEVQVNLTYIVKVLLPRRKGEVLTEFSWGNLREKAHLNDPAVNGRIILN